MMELKKPELVISAGSRQEAETLMDHGADAVTVGEEAFALRAPGPVDLEALRAIVEAARKRDKKVYVLVNALFHHEALPEVERYIGKVAEIGADAIVFGDPAVCVSARRLAPGLKLHWSAETTSTNYRTVNFWARKGASRALLARELSLNEVLEIKEKSVIPVQVQVHGMTCIFHSKRELVANYLRSQNRTAGEGARLFLKEHNRSDQSYPVFEDAHGTHIMSFDDICMVEHLGPLMAAGVDGFYIEGFGKTPEYNAVVVEIYRRAIDRLAEDPERPPDAAWMERIRSLQPAGRPLGTGFYFKEQIY